jgi:hypothetical protein
MLVIYELSINTTKAKTNVGFEVLTAVIMNNSIFWDITPCSQFGSQQTFRRTHVTSIFRVEEERNQCHLFHAYFLLGLFFDLEYGSDMLHRNVG